MGVDDRKHVVESAVVALEEIVGRRNEDLGINPKITHLRDMLAAYTRYHLHKRSAVGVGDRSMIMKPF
jgi:hypothetical protein